MNHHAWASKQLIIPIALAFAFAPALKAAESSAKPRLDGKTGSAWRVSSPPAALDHSSGAQEAAPQTSPASPTIAGQPMVKRPQVTYEDGQLTISAENSSLSEVMKAVRQALGADIDLPANVVDQHIWVHLGPGPASRVLQELLDGTEFNYVIQASESDPGGIRSVLLTPKATGAETAPTARTGVRWMPGHGPDSQRPADSENPAPAPEPVASADPSQAPPPAPAASASSASLQNPPDNSGSGAPKAGPTTEAEQQIQQLQSMYEQRRQIQIQQNQKPAGQN